MLFVLHIEELLESQSPARPPPLSPCALLQISWMTRLIVILYLLDIIVVGVCADHSTVNCLVNTILGGNQDAFSFPHPMDSTIDVAIMGDGEVRRDGPPYICVLHCEAS